EMKYTIRIFSLILVTIVLAGWGGSGHYIISSGITKFFNQEMQIYSEWVAYIADHASDADYRKDDDPSEGPKHYIDVDNYPEFIANGEISMDLQENIDAHGESFVEQNGYLPWATINSYNSLVKNLREGNWEMAKFHAADLGHYVADGHMPLHITANYNGQFTGNRGIHYRYESQMVNEFSSEIEYEGEEIHEVAKIDEYIFNYLYENYAYVDSVLLADDYAKSVNPNTDSYEYTSALWQKTEKFTIMLFQKASHALTELLYTAWLEAGKPDLTGIENPGEKEHLNLKIHPNPTSDISQIEYSLNSFSSISLILNSADGKINDILVHDQKQPGDYSFSLDTQNYPGGMYFLNMKTNDFQISKKILVLK
ncbi:MAG: T9SS type A sorting domain-containing protein, partial [bacterium]